MGYPIGDLYILVLHAIDGPWSQAIELNKFVARFGDSATYRLFTSSLRQPERSPFRIIDKHWTNVTILGE